MGITVVGFGEEPFVIQWDFGRENTQEQHSGFFWVQDDSTKEKHP